MVAYQGRFWPLLHHRSKEEARRRTGEALEKLLGGADFASVAKDYSDDPSTAGKGGNLGTVPLNELPRKWSGRPSICLEPGVGDRGIPGRVPHFIALPVAA